MRSCVADVSFDDSTAQHLRVGAARASRGATGGAGDRYGAVAALCGSIRIFAWRSGSLSASNAVSTPLRPTVPVISGRTSMQLGLRRRLSRDRRAGHPEARRWHPHPLSRHSGIARRQPWTTSTRAAKPLRARLLYRHSVGLSSAAPRSPSRPPLSQSPASVSGRMVDRGFPVSRCNAALDLPFSRRPARGSPGRVGRTRNNADRSARFGDRMACREGGAGAVRLLIRRGVRSGSPALRREAL
jgi:hypothetical protein